MGAALALAAQHTYVHMDSIMHAVEQWVKTWARVTPLTLPDVQRLLLGPAGRTHLASKLVDCPAGRELVLGALLAAGASVHVRPPGAVCSVRCAVCGVLEHPSPLPSCTEPCPHDLLLT